MSHLEEKVGYEQRRARSRRMHTITRKLARQKKLLATKYASKEKLHTRAQKLARQLLRKKLAGSRGANYSKLSVTQRIEIDKMIDSLPKSLRSSLSSRLIPYVTKAETVRITKYKTRRRLKESAPNTIAVPLEQGTPELTKRYKQMTPGQKTIDVVKRVVSEAIVSGGRPLRSANTVGRTARKRRVTKTVPGQKGGLSTVPLKRTAQGQRAAAKHRRRGGMLIARGAQRAVKNVRSSIASARERAQQSQKLQRHRRNINPN